VCDSATSYEEIDAQIATGAATSYCRDSIVAGDAVKISGHRATA
jgi:hypothetical protein